MQNSIVRIFLYEEKISIKRKLVIVIIVSIISFIYHCLFQPQRRHLIDALQNPNSYDKHKPKVNIEKVHIQPLISCSKWWDRKKGD